MASMRPLPLAVSLGDPAGIGPEVVGKCWDHRGRFGLPPFVAIGDPRSLAAVWDGPIAIDRRSARGRQRIRCRPADPAHNCRSSRTFPVIPALPEPIARSTRLNWRSGWHDPDRPRRSSPARYRSNSFTASASAHPGQTEFVAERCGVSPANVAMMLAGPTLRTVPVTTHIAAQRGRRTR